MKSGGSGSLFPIEIPEPPLGDFTGLSPDIEVIERFRSIIHSFFRNCGRSFPWREVEDPYPILVSEVMLQQTQTDRVLPKYRQFIERWPNIKSLSRANLGEVFSAWRGLGYNRRARGLLDSAKILERSYGGVVPDSPDLLQRLPMIGPATASAICAFAFRSPLVFFETNIRRVYIHFFFEGRQGVADRELIPFAETALDMNDPRSWYYALMDYGVFLKRHFVNPNRRSLHYARQGKFENSNRQIRGSILGILSEEGPLDSAGLRLRLQFPEERIDYCLEQLGLEGLVAAESGRYRIAD